MWQKLPDLPFIVESVCASTLWHDRLYVAVPTRPGMLANGNIKLCRLSCNLQAWQVVNVPTPDSDVSFPSALFVDHRRDQLLMTTVFQKMRSSNAYCDKVWALDDCSGRWKALCTLPHGGQATVVDGNLLIAAGGVLKSAQVEGKSCTGEVQVFDIQGNRWTEWPALPSPVLSGSLLPVQDHLLYAGGMGITNKAKDVFAIDPRQPTGWNKHACSPLQDFFSGTTTSGSCVFTAGGETTHAKNSSDACRVWRTSDGWSSLPRLPSACCQPSLSAFGKHLFAISGVIRTDDTRSGFSAFNTAYYMPL